MIDIKITTDGELEVNEAGDLALVFGDEQIAQEVLFRLKTTKGDWTLSPNVGASLERFIGQPNTEFTRTLIESEIFKELTRDNLLIVPSVSCIAINSNEVFILVEFGSLQDDNRVIQVQASLDMRKGLVFSRIDSREI